MLRQADAIINQRQYRYDANSNLLDIGTNYNDYDHRYNPVDNYRQNRRIPNRNRRITLPAGHSVLEISAQYTITDSNDQSLLYPYSDGEQIAQVHLSNTLGGVPTLSLLTVSGRQINLPMR
jgi:hypothetical protein